LAGASISSLGQLHYFIAESADEARKWMSSLYRASVAPEDVYAPTRPPKLKVRRGARGSPRLVQSLMRMAFAPP